jgi:hypothetical protein
MKPYKLILPLMVASLWPTRPCLGAETYAWPPALPEFSAKKILNGTYELTGVPLNSSVFDPSLAKVNLTGVIVFDPSPTDGAQEKLFFKKLFNKLQQSTEGRRILKGLVAEYRASGKILKVQISDFPGSSITINKDNIEEIAGRCRAYSYPSIGLYKLNRTFLQFQNQEAALRDAAANAAHELTHIRNFAEIKRLTKDEFSSVWNDDIRDEQQARLEGWIVATELSAPGQSNIYSEEIRPYLNDPEWYMESLGTEPSYVHSFDGTGIKYPFMQLQSRINTVKTWISDLKNDLPSLEFWSWALQHLKTVHNTSGLDNVRDRIDLEEEYYHALSALTATQTQFLSKDTAPLIAKMKRAADDPAYNQVASRLADYQDRLNKALKINPPPPAPPERTGQLTWNKFLLTIFEDQKEHPEHWLKAPFPASPKK